MAVQERFANNWATTLSVGTTSLTATSLTLTTVSGLPASGQMRFKLGSGDTAEKVIATLNGSATVTVQRGAEGTSAATHLAGEAVTAVLTAGALDNMADWARASIITHEGAVIVHDGEVVYL